MGIATLALGVDAPPYDASVTTWEELLHDVPDGIDIAAGIDATLTDEFGRGKAACAAQRAIHIVAVVVGKAKVDKAHIVVGAGDEDIVGLEVIVQHACLVQVGGDSEQLLEDAHPRSVVGVLGKIFGERDALDIFHDDGWPHRGSRLVGVDMDDVGM